jgi:hypothetical protein
VADTKCRVTTVSSFDPLPQGEGFLLSEKRGNHGQVMLKTTSIDEVNHFRQALGVEK